MFRRKKKQDEYQDEYYDESADYTDASAQNSDDRYDDSAESDEEWLVDYGDQEQIEVPRGSMLMSDDELMGNLPEEEYEDDEIRDYHPIRDRKSVV